MRPRYGMFLTCYLSLSLNKRLFPKGWNHEPVPDLTDAIFTLINEMEWV